MCKRKVDVDETLLQRLTYPVGVPILRQDSELDDFQGGQMTHHWHTEFQFGLLLRGILEYSFYKDPITPQSFVVHKGDGFFINSKVLHGCKQLVPGTKVFTFGMHPSFFASPVFGQLFPKKIGPAARSEVSGLFFKGTENIDFLRLFWEFHSTHPQERNYELHSIQLICQIWQSLLAKFGSSDNASLSTNMTNMSRVHVMMEFINAHYQDPITVDQIARAGDVSRRECFRCFREAVGLSPTQFLTQRRLSTAAYLLLTTNQPISSICEACGFENASYFSNVFKKRYGMTPRQFRK